MFTGLIGDTGEVIEVELRGDMRARIGCSWNARDIALGASLVGYTHAIA